MIDITEATQATQELVSAFERLIPQLSLSSSPPSKDKLDDLIRSEASRLLIARDLDHNAQIVGAITVALFPIPTGIRAWIDDLIVDANARGKGVGKALCHAAIKLATEAGASTINLTSRPSRQAANQLYQHIGFTQRQTNVYRYTPQKDISHKP